MQSIVNFIINLMGDYLIPNTKLSHASEKYITNIFFIGVCPNGLTYIYHLNKYQVEVFMTKLHLKFIALLLQRVCIYMHW